ncbi:MAG: hypothetical protein DRN06_04215 [Thermoprotei archaeon]|nr:MAG: hypothetical protein DRN06_04215 [Thermoprotei archaeon]
MTSYELVVSVNVAVAVMVVISTVVVNSLITVEAVENEKIAELALARLEDIVLHAAAEAPLVVEVNLAEVVFRPVEVEVNESAMAVRVRGIFATAVRSSKLPSYLRFNYTGLLPSRSLLYFTKLGGTVVVNVRRGG